MEKLVVPRIVFERIRGCRAKQRLAHPGSKIILGDLAMATRANPRVDIVIPTGGLRGSRKSQKAQTNQDRRHLPRAGRISERDSHPKPEVPLIDNPAKRVRAGDLTETIQTLHRAIGIERCIRDVIARIGEVRRIADV